MTPAYEIIEHRYDVVIIGDGGPDCGLHWGWRLRD
jgi:hypothetical protein